MEAFLKGDIVALGQDTHRKVVMAEHGLGIDWRGARRAFTDWKTYLVAVCLPSACPLCLFLLLQPTDRNRCRSFTAV
jgi:hypothetical protein